MAYETMVLNDIKRQLDRIANALEESNRLRQQSLKTAEKTP